MTGTGYLHRRPGGAPAIRGTMRLGIDHNQFIRWLNPSQSIFFSAQFFYKHLNGAAKRQIIPALGPYVPGQPKLFNGEVLPVPAYDRSYAVLRWYGLALFGLSILGLSRGRPSRSILPGPYDFPAYRCRTYRSRRTNVRSCLIAASRGPVYALRLNRARRNCARGRRRAARGARQNLVKPEKMPFTNITKKWFDSGDYPESLRRAVSAIDVDGVRARQKRGEPDGRLIGVGMATYCEQAAHGTSVYHGWGIPMVPGFEQATARLTPDGGSNYASASSHTGKASKPRWPGRDEILGIDVSKIKVVHGDTAMTYSPWPWKKTSISPALSSWQRTL